MKKVPIQKAEEYLQKAKDISSKKEDMQIVKRQNKELLELLLEKTGTKRKDLIELAYHEFVSDNLYLLTDEEVKHFDHLVIR